jgi:hypothetical protein
VQVQVAWVGVSGTPRPVPLGGGQRREAGGGRERGRAGERPGARAAGGKREEAARGEGGGARPHPGPSESCTSPCNFLA